MQIEIEVAEEKAAEVTFPCVVRCSSGSVLVYFAEKTGFYAGGEFSCDKTDHSLSWHRKQNDAIVIPNAATITLKAEDGTEFPRVMEWDVDSEGKWLQFSRGSGVRLLDLGSSKAGTVVDGVRFLEEDCKPLPPGTTTTIKIRDGEITATFEPPKDWLPVFVNDMVREPKLELYRGRPEHHSNVCVLTIGDEDVWLDCEGRKSLREYLERFDEEQANA